jgi:hypothetical protein
VPGWNDAMKRVRREWEVAYESVYRSDLPFPPDPVWLAGSGACRRYGYAAVAFCPITYRPLSGRLDQQRSVDVAIGLRFDGPHEGAGIPGIVDVADPLADERARRLFVNYEQVADLYRSSASGAADPDPLYDYLIVTTPDLVGAINASEFDAWKASRGHSLRTVLTTDGEIAGQPGIDLAERIRNFLRENFLAWGVQYLLLVGDYQSVPMRLCYPDPDFHVYDPWNPGLIAPGTPTDYYYADLSDPDSESWDSDGDGYHGEYGEDLPDFLAEIAVGRIPVDDPARITYALDKLVAFERDTGAWKRNVLHGGAILFFEDQDHSGYPFIDGATCLDSIETGLMAGAGYEITHFSERMGVVTSLFNWPALTEYSFTSNWGNGAHAIVNWSGHGWCDGAYRTVWAWDDGDGIPESGNGELQSLRFVGTNASFVDDDHPSVVFAISCNVGYPEPNGYGNLGIDLLTLPGWGASAGIVSSARPSAISGDWKHEPGGTEQICYDFNRFLIAEAERVGDALYDGKYSATIQYGWDLLYEYMNLYNFNLFGDPSLTVEGATVDAPDVAARGREPVRLRPVRPNPFMTLATMCLDLEAAGRVRVSVHDASGRQIRVLIDGVLDEGESVLAWDGTRADGERVAPGLYFIVCDAGGRRASQMLVHLK